MKVLNYLHHFAVEADLKAKVQQYISKSQLKANKIKSSNIATSLSALFDTSIDITSI
jgi:hypothetical protein